MAAITFTASAVRILRPEQNVIRRFQAGGTVSFGQSVYVNSSGKVLAGDATNLAKAQVRGIVVGVGTDGATSAASGDWVDVVTEGPVDLGASAANLTAGGVVYQSATAGALDQTAPATTGHYPFIIGWALSATAIYVAPQVAIPTANS